MTEEVYHVLKGQPYEFQSRRRVKVKGKGEMTTYFRTDRKQPPTVRVDDMVGLMHNLLSKLSKGQLSFGSDVIQPVDLQIEFIF